MIFVVVALLIFCDCEVIEDADADHIVDNLWLGSCLAAQNFKFLSERKIGLVRVEVQQVFLEFDFVSQIVTVTPDSECATVFPQFIEHERVGLLDDGEHRVRPVCLNTSFGAQTDSSQSFSITSQM